MTNDQTIEKSLATFLRDPSNGDVSDSNRQSHRTDLNNLIGNLIYLGRLPEGTGTLAMVIREVSRLPEYTMKGELELGRVIIEVMVLGRAIDSGTKVLRVAKDARVAITGYRGTMGDHYVHGCTLERGQMDVPKPPINETGHYWSFAKSADYLLTYEQEVPTAATA